MPRLFVAVWPPPEITTVLAGLDRPPVAGFRWTEEPQWHVTLRFLGRVADAGPVTAALAGVGGPPAEAVLGPAVDRFGQRVLVVPVGGLGPLAQAVAQATEGLGDPPEDRPFAGHVTLGRVSRRARVDLRPLTGTPLGGRWLVREITLVESRVSAAGARYAVVARRELV